MIRRESRDGNVGSPLGSQVSTSVGNIPPANSAYELPPHPERIASSQSHVYSNIQPSEQPKDFQPISEQEHEAQIHSDIAKRHKTESQFTDLFWPVKRVLLWILFRDLGRLDDDFLTAQFGARAYHADSMFDGNSRRTFLRALQDGRLPAIRDGREILREAWARASERRWPADVSFRREDILKLWPAPSSGTVTEVEPLAPTTVKLKGEALNQAIRSAIKEAIDKQSATDGKKLNGKQQVTEAMKILRLQGIEALRTRVDEIADAEFKQYRNSPGVTLKSQRPKS